MAGVLIFDMEMIMEEKKSGGKKVLIIILVIAIAAIAGVIAFKVLGTHRLVEVVDTRKDVVLERGDKEEDIYEGMHLITNDKVTTGKKSTVELLVDEDKHIEAGENTCFRLAAEGKPEKGYVKIKLIYGEGLFTIDEKLAENSEFEVITPNATCAVRGTTFSVAYDKDKKETVVVVKKGKVWVSGEDDEETLKKGEMAIINEDGMYVTEAVPEDAVVDDAPAADMAVTEEVVEAEEATVEETDAFDPESLVGNFSDNADTRPDTVTVSDNGDGTYYIFINLYNTWGMEGTGYLDGDRIVFSGTGMPDGEDVEGWFGKSDKGEKYYQVMFTYSSAKYPYCSVDSDLYDDFTR